MGKILFRTKFSVTSVTFVAELVLSWPPVQATMSFASTWSLTGPVKMKTNSSNKPREICCSSFLMTLEYSCLVYKQVPTARQATVTTHLPNGPVYGRSIFSGLVSFVWSHFIQRALSVATKCENVCTDRQTDRQTYIHTFHWTHILIRGFPVVKYS